MENKRNPMGVRFSEPNMKDLEILERIKKGDRQAFKMIHKKYAPLIRQHVYMYVHNRTLTEDIVQTIMAKVWCNIDKYRIEHTFNTWVWTIVRNHLVDHHRKTRTTVLSTASNIAISCEDLDIDSAREHPVIFENTLEDNNSNTESRIVERERHNFIKNLLGGVSDRERRIVEMFFLEEKTYNEIAEEMNIPLGTMKVLMVRAKEKIRNTRGAMETAKVFLV